LVQECQAEKQNLDAINAQRQHDYEMKKAQAMSEMSKGANTQMVMSGASGEALIEKIFKLD
jgi:hypothetical protein